MLSLRREILWEPDLMSMKGKLSLMKFLFICFCITLRSLCMVIKEALGSWRGSSLFQHILGFFKSHTLFTIIISLQ